MDPQVEELKSLVLKTLTEVEDIKHTVHSMRRAARVRALGSFVYWVIVIALLGASYYFYVAPYVGKIQSIYDYLFGQSASQQTTPAPTSFFQNIENWYEHYAPAGAPGK